MARPNKKGLDSFPFDVYLFDDDKIVAISGEYGIKGEITIVKLLCAIYKKGYYILWDELSKYELVKSLPGISPELLDCIVLRLVKWEFFDKELFDSTKILTSAAIQKRYFSAVKRRNKNDNLPYVLVCNNSVNVCNNPITVCNNSINADNNSVIVCNNSKTKKKENEKKSNTKEKINKKEKKESISYDILKKENLSLAAEEENQKEKIDFVGIQNLFNATLGGILPRIQAMTEARKKAVRARITQHGVEAIPKVFEQVLNSQFLRGNNDRNWTPNFDWIFNSTNFTRILEGNYNKKYQPRYGYSQYDAAKQRERETDEAFLKYAAEAFGKKTDDIAKIW